MSESIPDAGRMKTCDSAVLLWNLLLVVNSFVRELSTFSVHPDYMLLCRTHRY